MRTLRIVKMLVSNTEATALPAGERVVIVLRQHEVSPGRWYLTLLVEADSK